MFVDIQFLKGQIEMPANFMPPKMPKIITPLTDKEVLNAKAKDTPYILSDGGGLYLEMTKIGEADKKIVSKLWRMKFRQANGKEDRLSFRSYPTVSLADASKKRDDAKALIANGTDPAQAKRVAKITKTTHNANTFEASARAWHANKSETWQDRTARNVLRRLEKDVFPLIGQLPIQRHQSAVDAGIITSNRKARNGKYGKESTRAKLTIMFSYRAKVGHYSANYTPLQTITSIFGSSQRQHSKVI